MLLKVKFFAHKTAYNTVKPKQPKIAAIHEIPSPTEKSLL